MGILKGTGAAAAHPWDEDLYGEDRWDMPAFPDINGGNNQ
jgi:hypothetical protein